MPKVSVIVVNYNGKNCLPECLSSLFATNYRDLEIILIDNGSSDGSFELAKRYFGGPRIRFLRLEENVGYGKACNYGSSVATGEILAFLNNDVVVRSDWLVPLVSTIINDASIGAVQPKLLLKEKPDLLDAAGGYIDVFGNARERRGLAARYRHLEEVFYAKGAAIILPRKLFIGLGKFDEDFFLFYEETDLCWRIWLSGHTVVYVPTSHVLHARGATVCTFDLKSGTRAYLSARLNRSVMLLKNYELSSVFKILPIVVMNQAKDVVLLLILGAHYSAIIGTLATPLRLLRNFKTIWAKRHIVQGRRRVPDSMLFGRVILKGKPVYFSHELGDLMYKNGHRYIWKKKRLRLVLSRFP